MPPLPFFVVSRQRRDNLLPPGKGTDSAPHFLLSGSACWGKFRPPGDEVLLARPLPGERFRPPFSFRHAEKKTGRGRSKRKGRFFPDEPGKSQPIQPPFQRLSPSSWQNCSLSALPASLRASAVLGGVGFNSPPHHGQQEKKRSNCSPVLASRGPRRSPAQRVRWGEEVQWSEGVFASKRKQPMRNLRRRGRQAYYRKYQGW